MFARNTAPPRFACLPLALLFLLLLPGLSKADTIDYCRVEINNIVITKGSTVQIKPGDIITFRYVTDHPTPAAVECLDINNKSGKRIAKGSSDPGDNKLTVKADVIIRWMKKQNTTEESFSFYSYQIVPSNLAHLARKGADVFNVTFKR